MKENNNIEELFNNLKGQWDTDEPDEGHGQRFLDRLDDRKKKGRNIFYLITSAAAVILVLLGVFITYNPQDPENHIAKLSPKVQQTEMYFSSIIEKELAKVEKEDSPETQKLVKDALLHMQELEKDYDKITQELIEKGENKKLIHAMITNLQTRISFLEDVLEKIENIKTLKQKYHENNV